MKRTADLLGTTGLVLALVALAATGHAILSWGFCASIAAMACGVLGIRTSIRVRHLAYPKPRYCLASAALAALIGFFSFLLLMLLAFASRA